MSKIFEKLFQREKASGKRVADLFGKEVLSYKKKSLLCLDELYARRFE